MKTIVETMQLSTFNFTLFPFILLFKLKMFDVWCSVFVREHRTTEIIKKDWKLNEINENTKMSVTT